MGCERTQHECQFRRYSRGRSPVFGRPCYGYEVTCTCGWTKRVNGTRRYAEEIFRNHKREGSKQ